MSATYVQAGKVLDYKNSGETAINFEDVVVMGSMVGIAQSNIPAGGNGAVSVSGVYEIDAENTAAFVMGDKLYYDATNKKVTKTATNNTFLGYAAESKAESFAKALVLLNF